VNLRHLEKSRGKRRMLEKGARSYGAGERIIVARSQGSFERGIQNRKGSQLPRVHDKVRPKRLRKKVQVTYTESRQQWYGVSEIAVFSMDERFLPRR